MTPEFAPATQALRRVNHSEVLVGCDPLLLAEVRRAKGGAERGERTGQRAKPGLTVDVVVVRSLREFAELGDLDEPAHAISLRRFFDLAYRCGHCPCSPAQHAWF